MPLGLNWVDLVIIGILLLFALGALGRSLILEFLDFLSFLSAGLLSFSYYNLPAKFFESQFQIAHGLSLVLGFMVVWFLSETVFYLLIRLFLPKILKLKIPGSRLLSAVPAVLRGLVFIALALVMAATFPIQPSLKRSVLDSKLGSQILRHAYALEQPVKQVFGGVANDSLTFLTIKPKTDQKINLGFQTSEFTTDEVSENRMMEAVNEERVSRGFGALALDRGLRGVARGHSADMLKKGYFAHYSPEGKTVADRTLEAEIDFLVVGENLAYAPSVELAHKGLMNSEGHRANILSTDYGRIGIGVMDGGVYGRMFTQVFANSTSPANENVIGIAGESVIVSKVVDGDTIETENGRIVRLIGVDTPETKDPRRSVGCFGKEASNETKKLLLNKEVILQKDVSETDKYKRLLRYVFLPLDNGQMLFMNDYLVREGFAKVLTYPPDVKYNEQFRQAEKAAREDKRGLWGRCN